MNKFRKIGCINEKKRTNKINILGRFKEWIKKTWRSFFITESAFQYALVNRKDTNYRKTGFFIDYLHSKKIIRMGLYIPDDIELYKELLKKQQDINKQIHDVIWQVGGPKTDKIRWIKREIPISSDSEADIIAVIEIMSNIVDVLNKYLPIKFLKLNS